MFQRRVESRLTLDGYESTGGVLGALGRRAEDLYGRYDESGQRAAQQVFLRLVTVEEGTADTRRRIPLTELHGMGLDADALPRVLDDYGSHRLLTFDRDPETRAPTVEVAHEALLSRWDRLRTWVDDRRDDLVLHRRLVASVGEWFESGREQEYLLTGGRLDHFETFAAETDMALSTEEREFLDLSRTHANLLASRRRRRRNTILAGFATAAVIACILAVAAFASQRRADDEAAAAVLSEQQALEEKDRADEQARLKEDEAARAQEEAQRADAQAAEAERQATVRRVTELSVESQLALEGDPELGILLALEAIATEVDGAPLPAALDALHTAMTTSRLRLSVPGWWTAGIDGSGSRVVAAGPYGPVTVYELETGDPIANLPVTGDAEQGDATDLIAAISPDGTLIATGRLDGTIALWETSSGRELFSTNDKQTLWTDATAGTFTLSFHDEVTAPIAFDAEPSDVEAALEGLEQVADVDVAGAGSAAVPWRVVVVETDADYLGRFIVDSEGLAPATASFEIAGRGHDYPGTTEFSFDGVTDVEFSPDGSTLASRAWDGTIRIWDVATGTEQVTIDAPLGSLSLRDLVFSPDGSLIAGVVGEDPVYCAVWDATTGAPLYEFKTDREPRDLAFFPSGDELGVVWWGDENTALSIWELETGIERLLPGRGAVLSSVAVNSDGSLLATGDDNGNIYVKQVLAAGIADAFTISGHADRVWDLTFWRDFTLISTTENTTRVWDLSDAGIGEWLTAPTTPWGVNTVDYSSDGVSVAHTNTDGRAVIVDVQNGAILHELNPELIPEDEWVNVLGFSPAGDYLATSIVGWERPGEVQLWDARSGILVARWSLVEGVFWALAYSRDSSTLAGLSQIGESPRHEVRVWDLRTWEEAVIVVSDDPDAMPRGVAFSPDGTEFAVRAPTDRGAPVVFYNLAGEELRRCCEHPQPNWYYASVEYSPDGRHLLTTGTDSTTEEGTVKLWELGTGNEVSLEGHHDAALLGTFSPDGSRIASSGDSEIILWDAANLQPATVLLKNDATAMGLSFGPDGKCLVSAGYDPPLVRVWATDTDDLIELAQGRVFRTFTEAECEIYDIDPCPALD